MILCGFADRVGDFRKQRVDMVFFQDQGRRQGDDIAGDADQDILLVEAFGEYIIGTGAGLALARCQFNGADQTEVADVDDIRQSFELVDGIFQYCSSAMALSNRFSSA